MKKLLGPILLLVVLSVLSGCNGGSPSTDYYTYYTLNVAVSPNGSGSVILDPLGGTYKKGTLVTLTPNPNPGWVFSHWEGDLDGNNNPATITMNGNKSVTAVFTPSEGQGGQIEIHLDVPTDTHDINVIYISIFNPGNPNDHVEWSTNLTGTETEISYTAAVSSNGPYTVEVFANQYVDENFSFCLRAGQVTNVVPNTGSVQVPLQPMTYTPITPPPAAVNVGETLTMSGRITIPVNLDADYIGMIGTEFEIEDCSNYFTIYCNSFSDFVAGGTGQEVSFSGPATPNSPLTESTVFYCFWVGIHYQHPRLNKAFLIYYRVPSPIEDPLHAVTVVPNPG